MTREAGVIDANGAGGPPEERVREERKRYTTQLQRRAQAHVTAELGGPNGEADVDRQVTMVVQHALESSGARRVSLYRPVTRGRRWHVTTVLDDGRFYYGQAVPESLALPRSTYQQQRIIVITPERPAEPGQPGLADLGCKSYLGVPIRSDGSTVAVIEAVDVARHEEIDQHAEAIAQAAAALAGNLAREAQPVAAEELREVSAAMSERTILDLVLRPAIDQDSTIAITPAEWAVLNQLNGERPLQDVAKSAGMGLAQVAAIADQLVKRGLVRPGREGRRRV